MSTDRRRVVFLMGAGKKHVQILTRGYRSSNGVVSESKQGEHPSTQTCPRAAYVSMAVRTELSITAISQSRLDYYNYNVPSVPCSASASCVRETKTSSEFEITPGNITTRPLSM